jgi:hypothetical protein
MRDPQQSDCIANSTSDRPIVLRQCPQRVDARDRSTAEHVVVPPRPAPHTAQGHAAVHCRKWWLIWAMRYPRLLWRVSDGRSRSAPCRCPSRPLAASILTVELAGGLLAEAIIWRAAEPPPQLTRRRRRRSAARGSPSGLGSSCPRADHRPPSRRPVRFRVAWSTAQLSNRC